MSYFNVTKIIKKCRNLAFFAYFKAPKCRNPALLIRLTNWLSNTYEISYILYRYIYIVSNGVTDATQCVAQIVRTANEMSSTDNATPTNKSFND